MVFNAKVEGLCEVDNSWTVLGLKISHPRPRRTPSQANLDSCFDHIQYSTATAQRICLFTMLLDERQDLLHESLRLLIGDVVPGIRHERRLDILI